MKELTQVSTQVAELRRTSDDSSSRRLGSHQYFLETSSFVVFFDVFEDVFPLVEDLPTFVNGALEADLFVHSV